MNQSYVDALDSLLKFLGVLAPIAFGYYKYITDRKDKQQKEQIALLKNDNKVVKESAYILSNLMKFDLYSELELIRQEIYDRTKAMRFILFVAVNGKTSPRTVFAIFGHRVDEPDIEKKYKGIEVDDDYVVRLKELEKQGSIMVETMKLPPGMLKDIYFQQLVTFSYLKFIKRYPLTKEDDALVFCSIAADVDEGFSSIETTELDLIISGKIKPLIDKIITI